MKRILFVCTGNICRSPTAEAFFNDLVKQVGLQDQMAADSVGIANWHAGKPPDSRAIDALRNRGVDMSSLRARVITSDDYWQNDYLLAMDHTHMDFLQTHAGSDAGEIRMFLESLGRKDDVPDPFYGDKQDFEHALDLIEDGCRAWFEKIRATLPKS